MNRSGSPRDGDMGLDGTFFWVPVFGTGQKSRLTSNVVLVDQFGWSPNPAAGDHVQNANDDESNKRSTQRNATMPSLWVLSRSQRAKYPALF